MLELLALKECKINNALLQTVTLSTSTIKVQLSPLAYTYTKQVLFHLLYLFLPCYWWNNPEFVLNYSLSFIEHGMGLTKSLIWYWYIYIVQSEVVNSLLLPDWFLSWWGTMFVWYGIFKGHACAGHFTHPCNVHTEFLLIIS